MIKLAGDSLTFTFPKVHRKATLQIEFQRTLRIPDDDNEYYLPPGLGAFPMRDVDELAARAPRKWLDHGGVMLPMYQSEAMWLNFNASYLPARGAQYPFAIVVAAGKINAVSGKRYRPGLTKKPQNYLVIPEQPWLDGFCVKKGIIRQFVAMPLGSGYSAEEQLSGKAEHGGLQIAVYPMKRKVFERRFPKVRRRARDEVSNLVLYDAAPAPPACPARADMGLAPGGRMRQEIYDDPFNPNDWDLKHGSQCFVHIANSLVWRSITGEEPPPTPATAQYYTEAGLPWFDYYNETATAVEGSKTLAKLKSVATLGKQKKDVPLPENEPVIAKRVIKLRKGLKRGQVREAAL